MTGNEILALLMFASFILLVFSGFPVAWILGGLSVVFTALAIILEVDFNVPVGMSWDYASITVDRTWNVMENWVMVALPMFIFMDPHDRFDPEFVTGTYYPYCDLAAVGNEHPLNATHDAPHH